MYNVGDAVKVLAPFKETFPDVYTVTEETSGQTIVLGNPVTFPSLVYTAKQPVAP